MTILEAPKWHYNAPNPREKEPTHDLSTLPPLNAYHLGDYTRNLVTNVDSPDEGNLGRTYFDLGLRHMLSYQHEVASRCFLACLKFSPNCAFAHVCVALCHSPNYNFKGDPYYNSTIRDEESQMADIECCFPSQHVSDRHSRMAVEKVEELRRLRRQKGGKKKKKGGGRGKKRPTSEVVAEESGDPSGDPSTSSALPSLISDIEAKLASAVRVLTCNPGIDGNISNEIVGRPYSQAMRKVYEQYPDDAEIVYFFAESLMVLNAWELYEYPTGKPLSEDVEEICHVLETALKTHKDHVGLCHLYVHLSEMSSDPGKALKACEPLRTIFPHAGHLIHMPTHIDVLVGDYESCVRSNYAAILADEWCFKASPGTAGPRSFYFGYTVHNYHMLCYGAILGGMEQKAMEVAERLNERLSEDFFQDYHELADYLEAYSAIDIHVMVRFGRWKEILELKLPRNKHLMLFRTASMYFARSLAYANTGRLDLAKKEADRFDTLRNDPAATTRILHNNAVDVLLAVDAPMARGEIAYHEGKHEDAFRLLRKAVELQDGLRYDEPWGKMQPIRHALGGLLLEQGQNLEAEAVFRTDLSYHPKNPWALVGLISCLKKSRDKGSCCKTTETSHDDRKREDEIGVLEAHLKKQQMAEWADFDISVACLCCKTESISIGG